MKLYKLSVVLKEPSSDTSDKYLAEVPALSGCRAWGNTAAEAMANLQAVAAAYLDSYKEHGDSLPPEVEPIAGDATDTVISEVLVAV